MTTGCGMSTAARGTRSLRAAVRGGAVAAVVAVSVARAAPLDAETNSIGMRLIRIPTGEFEMGSHDAPRDLRSLPGMVTIDPADEHPLHVVRITQPFWMAAHETTVGQFRTFCRETGHVPECLRDGRGGEGWIGDDWDHAPGFGPESWGFAGQSPDHPVVNVTWNDALAFCAWLSRRERREYRLPSEAEWEYCCRAGSTTRYPHGDAMRDLHLHGNVADQSNRRTWPNPGNVVITLEGGVFDDRSLTRVPFPFHWGDDGYPFTAPVGRFPPNAWGLCDMIGNASEWCADRHAADWYARSPGRDPQGPPTGGRRVGRGSAHKTLPVESRSARRDPAEPRFRDAGRGFRVVRTAW